MENKENAGSKCSKRFIVANRTFLRPRFVQFVKDVRAGFNIKGGFDLYNFSADQVGLFSLSEYTNARRKMQVDIQGK